MSARPAYPDNFVGAVAWANTEYPQLYEPIAIAAGAVALSAIANGSCTWEQFESMWPSSRNIDMLTALTIAAHTRAGVGHLPYTGGQRPLSAYGRSPDAATNHFCDVDMRNIISNTAYEVIALVGAYAGKIVADPQDPWHNARKLAVNHPEHIAGIAGVLSSLHKKTLRRKSVLATGKNLARQLLQLDPSDPQYKVKKGALTQAAHQRLHPVVESDAAVAALVTAERHTLSLDGMDELLKYLEAID